MIGRIVVATRLVAGVDEAGRGPLAGPVVAAAVILDPAAPIEGLADSKVLTAARRDVLAVAIRSRALAWCVALADVTEIDALNILGATMLAMRRAVDGLATAPDEALIDGNRCPPLACRARAIVKGDRDVASREDRARRDAGRTRRAVPGVRLRAAQGLPDARPPRGAGAFRAVPCAPPQLRAGRPGRVRLLTCRGRRRRRSRGQTGAPMSAKYSWCAVLTSETRHSTGSSWYDSATRRIISSGAPRATPSSADDSASASVARSRSLVRTTDTPKASCQRL
jgi:hypothetical protein